MACTSLRHCRLIMGFRMFEDIEKRILWHAFIWKLPKVGDLVTKVATARFCRTLGTMVSSGVPILDGLDICSRTAGNRVIENVLKAKDSILVVETSRLR